MMNVYQSQAKTKSFQQHGYAGKLDEKACWPPSLQYLFFYKKSYVRWLAEK